MPLVGVSTEEAAAVGPISSKLDEQRLDNCCAVMMMAKQLRPNEPEPVAGERQKPQNIFLTWTCIDGHTDSEKFIRTRTIRLAHSPFKGEKSCLLVGAQAHRLTKKNNKRKTVNEIINVKSLHHSNLDITKNKINRVLDEFPIILCDNRTVSDTPVLIRSKILAKIDCSDPKSFRRRVEWGLKSTAIKVGKGSLSVRVGSTLLTKSELKDNIKFTLRFVEDHLPEIWCNLHTASVFTAGAKPLELLSRVSKLSDEITSDDKEKRKADNSDDEDDEDDTPIENRGIDIFAIRKRRKAAKV